MKKRDYLIKCIIITPLLYNRADVMDDSGQQIPAAFRDLESMSEGNVYRSVNLSWGFLRLHSDGMSDENVQTSPMDLANSLKSLCEDEE